MTADVDRHHNHNNNDNNGSNHQPQRINNNKNGYHRTSMKLELPEDENFTASEAVDRQKTRKKHRDKSDLGENFVAPDGGWGWLVAIAGGVNILVTFAVAQQFGIIFRERMASIGLNSSQLTTIINAQIAVSAFSGLINGPVFRRFTYRQVALFGSLLTFVGLFLAVFSNSFVFYVASFSCLYGLGRGLTVSASSLAVNTFFKLKRRTATAYQFGVAGLGPIVLPYFATFLLHWFGVQGTVLIFSGISLHTFACSLVYQPVKWHVQPPGGVAEASTDRHLEQELMEQPVEPETPTLPRANDGWYGSRHSLNSRHRLSSWDRERGSDLQLTELRRLNSSCSVNVVKGRSFSLSHSIVEEKAESCEEDRTMEHLEHEQRKRLPLLMKLVIFFDLDLLRDVTYVNLAVGLTLINFVEINFAILTPFILADFGFANSEIAMAMSTLGLCDLIVRFLIPAITARMDYSNKAFFVFGIVGMCLGRAALSCTRRFPAMMGVFVFMGLNKAFRTVFWSLIIPSHVPLKRLPAASGLQLLMSGLFSMAFGPLIGLIRDKTNYAFTLNFLNGVCVVAVLTWLAEALWRKRQRRRQAEVQQEVQ